MSGVCVWGVMIIIRHAVWKQDVLKPTHVVRTYVVQARLDQKTQPTDKLKT